MTSKPIYSFSSYPAATTVLRIDRWTDMKIMYPLYFLCLRVLPVKCFLILHCDLIHGVGLKSHLYNYRQVVILRTIQLDNDSMDYKWVYNIYAFEIACVSRTVRRPCHLLSAFWPIIHIMPQNILGGHTMPNQRPLRCLGLKRTLTLLYPTWPPWTKCPPRTSFFDNLFVVPLSVNSAFPILFATRPHRAPM